MNRMMGSEKRRKKKESIAHTSTPNGYDIKCGVNPQTDAIVLIYQNPKANC